MDEPSGRTSCPAPAAARRVICALGLGLALGAAAAASVSPPEDEAWWCEGVAASLERAGERRAAWEEALDRVPSAQRAALAFLLEHMPTRDLATLEPDFVLDNVALACAARDAVPWGERVPDEIFLNDILPYANVSERRDPWREDFMERFLPVVDGCSTPAEAAQRLNEHIFRELGVRYSTERKRADQSPAESIDSGVASCTGLSILLTDACRAVGVPARLAGIPNWVNKRGNHTWVEIWDGGTWHFTGAAEPDANGLDRAWFVADAALAQRDVPEHAIYAISYRRTGLEFPMAFDAAAEPVPAVNVTDRYAKPDARAEDETRLLVTVVDANGARVAAAVTVRDPADPTATFTGVTRDETFDTNDVLAFTIGRGDRCEVSVRIGGAAGMTRVEGDAPEITVAFVVDGDRVRPKRPG